MVRRPKRPATSKGRPKGASRTARRIAMGKTPARGATATRTRTTRQQTATRAARPRAKPQAVDIEVPAGWTVARDGRSMQVEVKTRDFVEALDVINEIGRVAEELEHHPDLHLERWNRLRILTYSHDVGRLTERDERLARQIGEVLAKRGLRPA